jgi:hypothetical protein
MSGSSEGRSPGDHSVNDLERARLLEQHCEHTADILLKHWRTRDRLFLYLLLVIAVIGADTFSPRTLGTAVNSYLWSFVEQAEHRGMKEAPEEAQGPSGPPRAAWQGLDFSAIDLIVRFLLLLLLIHYYQKTVQVQRMFAYLDSRERILNRLLKCSLITRDGVFYYANRPPFSRWLSLLFEKLFPIGMVLLALASMVPCLLTIVDLARDMTRAAWIQSFLGTTWDPVVKNFMIHVFRALCALGVIISSLLFMKSGTGRIEAAWDEKSGEEERVEATAEQKKQAAPGENEQPSPGEE